MKSSLPLAVPAASGTQKHLLRFAFVLLLLASVATRSYATHEQAPISDIDHSGMGTFMGNYTQSATDHPWFVFNASAGNTITVAVNTNWVNGSHSWLYQASDGCAEIGDNSADGTLQLLTNTGSGSNSYSITYNVTTTGQYALQLDSWLGGDGAYTVTISGSTVPTVLCTTGCVAPDLMTAAGDPRYPAGQTSVTGIFQNSGPVNFNYTNCPGGTVSWTGSNGSSGNSTSSPLALPTTTLGMVTYSATCTIGSCTSEATMVSITTVKDNRCGPNNQNVLICYYGVTQCVSPNIAARYMRLGATMGACGSGGGNARIGVEETAFDAPFALSVKGYPNPTQGELIVEVMSKITGPAQIQILDLTGRAVQQRTEQLLEGLNEVKFDLTAQPSGTYLIRATDALNRQGVVRVSKQ